MNQEPKPTNLSEKIEGIQLILCSIVGTIILVVWITSWDVIINIFKPDFLRVLSLIRVGLASVGLIVASLVGVKAAAWLLSKAIELRSNYKELIELKKIKDDNKD